MSGISIWIRIQMMDISMKIALVLIGGMAFIAFIVANL